YKLSLEFKMSRKEDNSGVFVRFPDPGNDPWVAVKEGYELQICEGNEKQFTGTVYNLHPRNEGVAAKAPGEWNLYEIEVDGQKMTVTLNGEKANEYTGEKKTERGFIGLQNHDPKSHVSFRNIKVTELSGAATKPVSVGDPKEIDKTREKGLVGRYYKDTNGFV